MQTVINRKKNSLLHQKKGSYIVEAAICLPVFLLGIITLFSLLLMYACIEDSAFAAATELRRGAIESHFADTGVLIPYRIKERICRNNSVVKSCTVKEYRYRKKKNGIDEVIALKMSLSMGTMDPLGFNGKARYELAAITRAYVGRKREAWSLSRAEFLTDGEVVYIFPKDGERYHAAGCTFLKEGSRSTALTASIKRKYDPCPLCDSGNADTGALVYIFPQYGECYHLSGCEQLSRNYIMVEKQVAISRGYTPCAKCGG